MKFKLTLFLFLSVSTCLLAQETQPKTYHFTLQEAINFALDSSYTAINARRDIAKALKKKWETTADGLPQISANIDYQNRLKQAVQLLPGELAGQAPGTFIPVTFGTKQQMTATATAQQLLFDGSYFVAVRAAKTFLAYTHETAEKTALTIRKNVIDAYGNVLMAKESAKILSKNKATLEQNLNETQQLFKNGLQNEESVQQLQITYEQIKNQLSNAKRLVLLSQQTLNLALGIPLKNKIILMNDLDQLAQENISLELMNAKPEIQKNVDFQLAENLTEQREHELNLQKSMAMPRLTTFINYGTSGYSQSFSFLNDNQNWFQSSTWGVSLTIPIFSSLKRSAQTQQAKIALDQAKTQFKQAKEQISLQIKRAKSNYQLAVENYQTNKKNLKLAESIEHKNEVKFKSGVASSFELRQAQTQLYTAQQQYLQSMVDLLNAKATLETELNTPQLNFAKKQ